MITKILNGVVKFLMDLELKKTNIAEARNSYKATMIRIDSITFVRFVSKDMLIRG